MKSKHRRSSQSFGERARRFFGSRWFFGLTVGLLVFQASWIALSARYPQAFDEQFHFGIIQIYSHHWSPFLTQQPPHADQYGALTRDPSYLYQYLMSFPYRFVRHFTSSLTSQIIALRLMNVLLLASSLFIFRKLLRFSGVSTAAVHVILAFLVLLPITPLLGSQINYDNLFIPLSALAMYWTLLFLADLRDRRIWQWPKLIRLLALCLIASVVKYPFLPIFVAIAVSVAWTWWQNRAGMRYVLGGKLGRQGLRLVMDGLLLVVSLGLFIQRDGINLLTYMTPVPGCNQVLTVSQCRAYLPWGRNYGIAQQHLHPPLWQVLLYPFDWLYHMVGELVFTISSSFNSDGTVDYFTGSQTIVVEVLAWTVFGIGMFVLLSRLRSLWKHPVTRVFLTVSTFYVAALWIENFRDYVRLGEPLAIHGRYLLPILPLLLVMMWLALRETLGRWRLKKMLLPRRAALVTALTMIILLVEGGGFVTYILRSQPSWFWPQSHQAQNINAHAQKLLKPVVLDINLQD